MPAPPFRSPLRAIALSAALLAASLPSIAATPRDGALDRGFGLNGLSRPLSGDSEEGLDAIAVQDDGRVLALSRDHKGPVGTYRCRLLRLREDGRIDTGFGRDGQVRFGLPFGSGWSSCDHLALLPDGKILIVGRLESQPMLMRFNPDGSADTDFGDGGMAVFDTGIDFGLAAFARQADGAIVLAGTGGYPAAPRHGYAVAVRLRADGSADTGFGVGGVSITDFPTARYGGYIEHVALQADGRIVMAGTVQERGLLLMRLRADGRLDTEFGRDGRVVESYRFASYGIQGFALQSDGSILTSHDVWPSAPHLPWRGTVVRHHPDGRFDYRFRRPDLESPGRLTVLADGRATVAYYRIGETPRIGMQRFAMDGSVDPAFVLEPFDTGDVFARVREIAVDNGGRIVLGIDSGSFDQYTIARVHNRTYCFADPANPGRFLGFSPSGWFASADSGVGGSGAGVAAKARLRRIDLPGQAPAYALSAGGPAPAAYRIDAFARIDGDGRGSAFANAAVRREGDGYDPGRYALIDPRTNDSACRLRSGR
ncbi:hypothetical protein J5226_13600 [Lysobacter sp. K5869]|uniref:hypothetical protein n=1 Tax=Lysobacter sp. K5869 TaxID=2820808 RepID=UPI001C0630B4|nr:hypothetical protein [Lysobacter sp. K5869]QWP74722.1 hypothetical protein J5226_13600 [Lysobacter sp. K5869]